MLDCFRFASKVAQKALKGTPLVDALLAKAEKEGKLAGEGSSDLPNEVAARAELEAISPRPKACFGDFSYQNAVSCDLSVIVPVFNTERFVGGCLDSILAQDVNFDMEVVAVNDGSTDRSLEVLQSRAEWDGRLRIVDQENKGFSGARNAGIDVSRGRVLCFVDSDDMLVPGHLNALWSGIAKDSGVFVSGTYTKMSEDGEILAAVRGPRIHGAPWSRLFWREQWSDIRFPEGFWFEDTLIAYCIKSRYTERFVQDAGYLRRVRTDSITATHDGSPKSIDSFWVVEEMIDWCRKLSIPLERVYEQTVVQFGSLLWDRTRSLDDYQRRCLFVCCCCLVERVFGTLRETGSLPRLDGRLGFLERSLLSRNYPLWRESCKWIR